MPVVIRNARCFVAGFSASADAVGKAIAPTGLQPMILNPRSLDPRRFLQPRTMAMLVFVQYIDGDLGPYHEFGVCFLVNDPDQPAASPLQSIRSLAKSDARALIHHLPVDGDFTLAAGRGIWGFPKTIAEFDVDHDSSRKHGAVRQDGHEIVDLTLSPGIPVPDQGGEATLQAYSYLDGVLRRTPWHLTETSGVRTRIGGAKLTLGSHPIADELRTLDLSRHALMTSSVGKLQMEFQDATILSPAKV
ncbi:MAG: acetoacetate decarboxylase family protein [Gordonia sp. (in: high G+C Gram-positive bacteria)]|uniref:acetoacetate decarboxylase family protein n=1 Tax=Gordonia sp. (in: high G+C Gram-positive bacteria) TaxID=84139 RepID=UPI0039E5995D